MWRNTRLVVFAAVTASLYAAILIPFKVLPLIPGITELRPANAVPVLCSFLFGPAAAFGAAIGNSIGDLFGGVGPGDFFGFAGNFLYGLIPYRVWRVISSEAPVPTGPVAFAKLAAVIFVASAACALVVGWGLNLLGFVPFPILANVVLWNNFLVAGVLAPILLAVIYPRVESARLTYASLAPPLPPPPTLLRGALLLAGTVAVLSGHVAGNLIYAGLWLPPWLPAAELSASRAFEIGFGLAPFVAVAFFSFVHLR